MGAIVVRGETGWVYEMFFKHHNNGRRVGRRTECFIRHTRERARHLVLSGCAYCHPHDNYCKETGRKIALARALERVRRDDRRLFWQAYFARNENEKEKVSDGK